jgi:hypothetical protein
MRRIFTLMSSRPPAQHAAPVLTAALAFLLLLAAPHTAQGCTIFVLTDAEHTLFCNNEDWSDTRTRIWFVPAGQDWWPGRSRTYGCVYVGFANGTPQGGMNTAGLAYDWVAGYKETWQRHAHPEMKNLFFKMPPTRMLETCATVEEAIAFYRKHWDVSFAYARIMVADRSGASVIISARDNQLVVEKKTKSCGFGYAGKVVGRFLATKPTPTPANAALILTAAQQQGRNATRYANVFDLRSGDIHLYPRPGPPEAVVLSLQEELKKGRHRYDMQALGGLGHPGG